MPTSPATHGLLFSLLQAGYHLCRTAHTSPPPSGARAGIARHLSSSAGGLGAGWWTLRLPFSQYVSGLWSEISSAVTWCWAWLAAPRKQLEILQNCSLFLVGGRERVAKRERQQRGRERSCHHAKVHARQAARHGGRRADGQTGQPPKPALDQQAEQWLWNDLGRQTTAGHLHALLNLDAYLA